MNEQQISAWKALCKESVAKIDAIDKSTSANSLAPEQEPKWWLEMMEIRRMMQKNCIE